MAGTKLTTLHPNGTRGMCDNEQHVRDRLAHTHGLAWMRLNPHNNQVQLVGYDGTYLGRIRLASTHGRQSWNATPAGQPVSFAHFANARAAAVALARAAGITE